MDGQDYIYKALNSDNDIRDFVNPFSLDSSTEDLECSFNGGCSLSMSGTAGVLTAFKADSVNNYIKVCEQKCVFDEDNSDTDAIQCRLGPVPTTYSNQDFQIGKVEQELNSGVYFGVSDVATAFDGSVFTRVDDNTNNCVLGMAFKEGYVGALQVVKYFINYITDRS
jgi:hypothetical protein